VVRVPVIEDIMSEKVVVCGAGGFVGGNLVKFLMHKGYPDIRAVSFRPVDQWLFKSSEVENIQLDLRHYNACKIAVSGATWVYNLAAKVGGIGYIQKNKTECMLSSLINTHLLQAMAWGEVASVAGYFFASSACVYPTTSKAGDLIKENDLIMPSDGYGIEKFFSERLCASFSEEHNLPTRVARYHTVYGPGDDIKGREGKDHAPSALCRKVAKAKISGQHEINIWGDGEQTRDFLYVNDCVEATYRLMGSGCNSDPVNVGSPEIVTINQMVTMLEEIAGVRLTRFYSKAAPEGVRHRGSDNTRLKSILKWEPTTTLYEGLSATYRNVYDGMLK